LVSDYGGYGSAWKDPCTNCGVGYPVVFQFDGTGGESIDAVAGDIVAHTNSGDANSGILGEFNVLFTSPVAGDATITGNLWDAHTSVDRDQDWTLLVNGILQASGTVLGDGTEGRNNRDQFAVSVFLAAGDTVALQVQRALGQIGGYVGMNMNVSVSEIPIPAALPLFATGVAGLAYAGRRRKAKATA
jgi:hypothetical protein